MDSDLHLIKSRGRQHRKKKAQYKPKKYSHGRGGLAKRGAKPRPAPRNPAQRKTPASESSEDEESDEAVEEKLDNEVVEEDECEDLPPFDTTDSESDSEEEKLEPSGNESEINNNAENNNDTNDVVQVQEQMKKRNIPARLRRPERSDFDVNEILRKESKSMMFGAVQSTDSQQTGDLEELLAFTETRISVAEEPAANGEEGTAELSEWLESVMI